MSRRSSSAPRPAPVFAAAAAALLGLALALSTACERHPAGEPALWYGHGSGKPESKDRHVHWLDGRGSRFSDTQGTEVPAPGEESHEGEGSDLHRHPGPSSKHEAPNRADAEKPARHE